VVVLPSDSKGFCETGKTNECLSPSCRENIFGTRQLNATFPNETSPWTRIEARELPKLFDTVHRYLFHPAIGARSRDGTQ
jgi:hypothetical protein